MSKQSVYRFITDFLKFSSSLKSVGVSLDIALYASVTVPFVRIGFVDRIPNHALSIHFVEHFVGLSRCISGLASYGS